MIKKRPTIPYQDLDPQSHEYKSLHGKLVSVVDDHIGEVEGRNSKQIASEIINIYNQLMLDFWERKQVTEQLDQLKRNLAAISIAYKSLPLLVRDKLDDQATHCDDDRLEKFMQTTQHDILWDHLLPEKGSSAALRALETLSDHYEGLIEAIELTRRQIPRGIKTRNRQTFGDWALVHACVWAKRLEPGFDDRKDVSETGEMFRLITAVFDAFDKSKRSYRRTYKSWKEHLDGKNQNFDLMDI